MAAVKTHPLENEYQEDTQTDDSPPKSRPDNPERQLLAVFNIAVGLLLGLLATVIFYNQPIGVGFSIYIGVVVLSVLAMSIPARTPITVRNAWTLLPMGFFAVMVAVRADGIITFLNVVAVFALGGLTLHYLPLKRYFIDLAPFMHYISRTLAAWIGAVGLPFAEVARSVTWLSRQRFGKMKSAMAVVRGLVIAVPILIIFGALLASADAIFADYINDIGSLFTFRTADGLFGRILMTGIVGWLAAGALAYGLGRQPDTNTAEPADEAQNEKRKRGFSLGFIESTVVLGSVDLLFGAFVLIQFAYFFGGGVNVGGDGLTYSEYARRGFFELVTVSVLTLGLVLLLDWSVARESQRENTVFRGLSVVMTLLTLVMLASAWQRMALYESAFGFTHLRVYTHVFMAWMAVLFIAFLASLFRVRKNAFSLGLLLVCIGYLGTLNVMNVDRYIATHNIDRIYNGEALDIFFLGNLSADAVPPIAEFYAEIEPNTAVHDKVGQWLALRLQVLDTRATSATIFSANVSNAHAYSILDPLRDDLPEVDLSYWYYSSYGSSRTDYYYSDLTPAVTGTPSSR